MIRRETGRGFRKLFFMTGFLGLLATVFSVRGPSAARTFLVSEDLERALLNELSGQRALDSIAQLALWDRTTSSPGYMLAVRYVESRSKAAGVDFTMESYGADQSKMAFTLRPSPYWPPVGWNVKGATLHLVRPRSEKIADYLDQPLNLARYSRAADVEAELVDAGLGTREEDYRGLDCRGKIVLATSAPQNVQQMAVKKYGAAGTITWGMNDSYFPGADANFPDLVGWQVLNPRKVDGFDPTFAFSLSRSAGEKLRSLLKAGSVVMRAKVDVIFTEERLLTPTALIRGRDLADQEFLFSAHIDHVKPSANDNASGSALILEIERALSRIIADGRVPRPRRSIRFLWVSEGPGTTGYVTHHPDARDHIRAAMNLDMVGENAATTHSMLRLTRTPDSLPSFLPDLVDHMLRWVDSLKVHEPNGSRGFLNYRIHPFSPSSDHYILDDGVLKIPAIMLNFAPDEFHHTNMDTTDNCDPTELKRVGLAGAAAAYFVANARSEELALLAREVAAKGTMRVLDVARQGVKMLHFAPSRDRDETYALVVRWVQNTSLREQGAIRSTLNLESNGALQKLCEEREMKVRQAEISALEEVNQVYESLAGRKPPTPQIAESDKTAAAIVPVFRKEFFHHQWDRFLDDSLMEPGDRQWLNDYRQRLSSSYMRIPEFLNFIDGKRNLLHIRDAVSVERFDFSEGFSEVGTSEGLDLVKSRIDLQDLLKLMKIFQKQGWINWGQSPKSPN